MAVLILFCIAVLKRTFWQLDSILYGNIKENILATLSSQCKIQLVNMYI